MPKYGNAADGSTCIAEDDTFTYVLATKAFAWKRCVLLDAGDPLYGSPDYGPFEGYVEGSRTLSTSEDQMLRAAIEKMTIHLAADVCGADKPYEQLELTSPSALGPSVYYDQFYHCADDGKSYVDHIDDAFTAAGSLAS